MLAAAQGALELSVLEERFRDILASVGTSPEAAKLIGARRYLAAAALLARSVRPGEDTLLSEEARRSEPSAAALPPSALPVVTIAPSRSVDLDSLTPAGSPADIHVARARTKREIRRAQALRTVIVGALFLAVACATYSGNYVGTLSELIGIFFWAFSADLTVSKLLEVAKS